jgi:cardiolipin synthase
VPVSGNDDPQARVRWPRVRGWFREARAGVARRRGRVIAAAVLVFHVLGLVSSVHAIMTARTAQGAIAWAVSLNTFPYGAVPAYWVFGRRKFSGYVEAFQEREADIARFVKEFQARLQPYEVEQDLPDYAALKALAGSPVLHGNEVELLVDGEATFDSIIQGVERARESILVEFYIVRDDGLGRRLQEALIRKAREGVRVLFLFDELGSGGLTAAYQAELREAGARVAPFNTRQGPQNRFQLNFRNHRKIVVVDGTEAWIGGHNVGDEYLGLDPKVGAWRDTHVRLSGPAALLAQVVFAGDWYWATRELVKLDWEPKPSSTSDVKALVVGTGPADRLDKAELFHLHALNAARERIWIATPYFVPDEGIVSALQLAALRGVDVRVILPANTDNYLVWLASFWFIEELADDDVRFYFYDEGFMHQKVLLVDDFWSAVGTANFDNRSFRLNFEVTALVADRDFAGEMEQMLLADLERSTIFDPARLEAMPFYKKIAVRTARLFSPVL